MGISIALGLFGALVGVTVRSRVGAVLAAAGAAFVAYFGVPAAIPYLAGSVTGRRLAETLAENGAAHLQPIPLFACAVVGVLLAWMFFGRPQTQHADWTWDPDKPRRDRRRRRAWV